MNTRTFRHKLAVLSLGGSALLVGGSGTCQNDQFQAFFTGIGNAAIGQATHSAFADSGENVNTVFVPSFTSLLQAFWSSFIDLRFADSIPTRDPVAQ